MTPAKLPAPIPRFALTIAEAAASLGMGATAFNEYVRPHVRLIRRGKYVAVPVADLARWAEENAEKTL